MSYIGANPTTQSFIAGTDYFNGDGSTTAFTLSRSVVSTNDIQATVNNVVQQPNTAYTVSGTTITFTSAPSAGSSNIYVRYLSTTTQSITPSQNTVSYSTLNSDNQSKLGISFKNRIINGAMVIDQRNAGASVTVNANQYTLDRWQVFQSATGKYSVQQNAGSVTPPVGFQKYLGCTSLSSYSVNSGDYFFFQQVIEANNMQDLAWGTANAKTVTLSFQVYSSVTGTFSGSIENYAGNRSYPFTYTVSSANTWTSIAITVAGDTTGTWTATGNSGWGSVNFDLGSGSTIRGNANTWAAGNYIGATGSASIIATSGATFYLTGVQLEVGTQATTFDYRSIGTELILCQRYYQAITYLQGLATGSTSIQAGATTKVTMRASPTLALPSTSPVFYSYGNGTYTASGATLGTNYPTVDGVSANITGFSGLTSNWNMYSSGAVSPMLTASAEL